MSALKSFTQIAQASETKAPTPNQSVTNISVHARVDYTLRFSTPAVYVLGEDASAYSHVASHYIGSIDNERNVAFIACSSQLNNIQIRCRIVEQLFGDQLFDPEQPLSVSIINLMKKQVQPLAIVLEHSQFLSLQITHELCQLAQIAKKSQLDIQVLMVGTAETGYLIGENALLFKDKVTIVQSDNAQLINLQSKVLKRPSSFIALPKSVKVISSFALFSGLVLAATYALWQLDVVNFSSLPSMTHNQPQDSTNEMVLANQKSNLNGNNASIQQPIVSASTQDILNAINGVIELPKQETTPAQPAKPQDILSAIESLDKVAEAPALDSSKTIALSSIEEKVEAPAPVWPEHDVFTREDSGFVIQYGAFTSDAVKAGFLSQYQVGEYHTYQRELSGKNMSVITSPIYKTKAQAQEVLLNLPSTLQDRGIWVKDIKAIKDEISAFESSQLQ